MSRKKDQPQPVLHRRCPATKHGRFDMLNCCLLAGHTGKHLFVVSGVTNKRERPMAGANNG